MIQSKEDIIQTLEKHYQQLENWLNKQPLEQFSISPIEGKWSTGEHIDHLIRGTQPLNQALRMPKLAIRTMFGKPNREGRNYEELVAKYLSKLSEGGRATGAFVPKNIAKDKKAALMATLQEEKAKLQNIISKWEDRDLDNYLLPHPLLGKLTVREMLYFIVYHTEHHLNTLVEKY
jgi:hypothetical protein